MKKVTSILAVLMLLVLATEGMAQTKEVDFNSVDLKKLRKKVIVQLQNDGLLNNRKEKIHLELRTNTTVLNGEELDERLHAKYSRLADEFEIGRGSFRTIYITHQCTAVGDFHDGSFKGKMEGRMRIQEVYPSAE